MERRRTLIFALLVFLAVALWFAALFAFGNAGALWLLAIYSGFVLYAGWLRFREEFGLRRLEWDALPLQAMAQGPGFTSLELEAIRQFTERSSSSAKLIDHHFRNAEVRLRLNTGMGCVVAIETTAAWPLDQDVLAITPWFEVDGLKSPVGCRFWPTDGIIDLMEFFCGGEGTRDLDWTSAAFSVLDTGPRQTVPKSRPVLDISRLTALMTRAREEMVATEVRR